MNFFKYSGTRCLPNRWKPVAKCHFFKLEYIFESSQLESIEYIVKMMNFSNISAPAACQIGENRLQNVTFFSSQSKFSNLVKWNRLNLLSKWWIFQIFWLRLPAKSSKTGCRMSFFLFKLVSSSIFESNQWESIEDGAKMMKSSHSPAIISRQFGECLFVFLLKCHWPSWI